ncbi:MAG: biosynthetic peptidoglycan transglycosylase, partial [Myxococcota bacterium]
SSGEASGGTRRIVWDGSFEEEGPRATGSLEFSDVPFDLFTPFLPSLPWWQPEAARVSADISLSTADGVLTVEGSADLRDFGLSSPRIAPRPVEQMHVGLRGHAELDPAAGDLRIRDGAVTLGEASMELAGNAHYGVDHWSLNVDARLPPTDCNDAVGAIPADLLADAASFSWTGRMQGRLRASIDSRNFRDTDLSIDLDNRCRFVTAPAMADLARVQGAFLHRVAEPDGTTFEMMAGPGSLNWAPIETISPFFIHAVVGHEDAGFFRHNGFAEYAIEDALARNLREGRYVVGASTITMQLAKNLFLHREKTLARKVQEVILTWWVESSLEKPSILELYFNIIEYGPQVYGIVSAADHYFGVSPSELSVAQSAFLATILPNPKVYHESFERGRLSRAMRNRMTRFIRHLHARARIDDEALAAGLEEVESFAFGRPVEVRGTTAELPFPTLRPGRLDDVEDPASDAYESGESFFDSWF